METISNEFGPYDRPRVLGCEPEEMVVLSSNQLNIAMFVYQMGDVCIGHLVNKSGNIYLI